MESKVHLCRDGGCCPAVEFRGNEVSIGEDANTTVLTREQWNILVEKVKTGKLSTI